MPTNSRGAFSAKLFRYPGKGGWTFVEVPKRHAPPVTQAWGRTPVVVTLDGRVFKTSVWTEKSGRVLLPVSKKNRGQKSDGDTVQVVLELDERAP